MSARPDLLTGCRRGREETMDALSEVLRLIRLQGALFLNGRFHEPWCVQVPPGADAARFLCPGARQLGILHMVLEGRCWVRLAGREPFRLQAGDVVALPVGDGHLIGCGPDHAPVDPRHALRLKLPELAPLRYGGEGEATSLVCGWFAYEGEAANPLLAALPRVLRVPLGRRPAGAWIAESLRYALAEAAAGHPGATALTAKVAESMFLETLRAWLDDLPPQQSGWLAGLRDPQVGHCLALMHDQPARNWSLDSLAHEVHSSRSVLSERFTGLLGTPPMKYLKHWRLSLAARLLCSERSKLLEVAEAVGYESEASFSRAFKGAYGVSPGAWRATAGRSRALQP
jgi:AraC-like DNA-binding protein